MGYMIQPLLPFLTYTRGFWSLIIPEHPHGIQTGLPSKKLLLYVYLSVDSWDLVNSKIHNSGMFRCFLQRKRCVTSYQGVEIWGYFPHPVILHVSKQSNLLDYDFTADYMI